MDPIGYALDKYDAIGARRAVDELGYAIDTRTELDNGRAVASGVDLQREVVADPRFARCIVDKTWTYALGRQPVEADEVYLEVLADHLVANDYRFEALVQRITSSPPFLLGGAP